MAKRKRATRSTPKLGNTLSLVLPKPRNPVLQAAASGSVKLGTARHEKSKGALRRAAKMDLIRITQKQAEH
jgi:hypothetical protein